MDVETIRAWCFERPGVTEDLPFGEDVLVLRVNKKIFALINIRDAKFVNLKADPERTADWRDRYEGVRPGYHMNKKYWNSVYLDGSVPIKEIRGMIDHSYEIVAAVAKKTPRKKPTGKKSRYRS